MKNSKNLIQQLETFVKSNDERKVIVTTITELRKLFKPREESNINTIIYYIFNSVWNRIPNFNIPHILQDKLKYLFKIGIGIASYNQLPISWITDANFKQKNFLMKDRGHITTLICSMYSTKFSIKLFEKVVIELIKEFKSVTGWKEDSSLSNAVSILEQVDKYIKLVIDEYKKNGTKKSEATITIQMICENISSFGKKLNSSEISIEISKESIYIHMQEILAINNSYNKWIEYQKALLAFFGILMRKDGSDSYLTNIFKIEAIRNFIDELKTFTGDSKITLFSSAITSYKRKISEYSQIIPIRFLGLRALTSFDKRGSYYYASTENAIKEQLMALHTHNISEDIAKTELLLMDKIASNPKWDDYEKHRKNLLKNQPDTTNTLNLKDASLVKEDFGMACIDAIIELKKCLPHIGDRTSDYQISELVTSFVNELIIQTDVVVNDETLFMCGASMDNRFQKLILPTYEKLKDIYQSQSKNKSKESISETLLDEIKGLLPNQTSFKMVSFTNETYQSNNIKIITIDFKTKTGLDLGQRRQGMGYTIDNCIIQQKNHNRSSNNINHDISNIDYWKWAAKHNLDLATNNKQYLIDNAKYDVLTDADRLNTAFNPT